MKKLAFLTCLLCCAVHLYSQMEDQTDGGPDAASPAGTINKHEKQARLDDHIYWLEINAPEAGQGMYSFTISKHPRSDGKKAEFDLLNIDMANRENVSIFELLLTQAFFDTLHGQPDSLKVASRPAFAFEGKEYGRVVIPPREMTEIKADIDKYQTNYAFDGEQFMRNIREQTKGLAEVNKQPIEAYAQKMVQANQAGYEQLKSSLIKKGMDFLAEAEEKFKTGALGNTKGADHLFSHDEVEVDTSLTESFKKRGAYLNRKSVEIGNQIYFLSAKKITQNDNDYYVFNLSLGARNSYFQMESVAPNASTINAMAKRLNRALQKLKLTRQAQLDKGQLGRVREIAGRLSRDPEDYNIEDDAFLETAIEEAADQYGFSSQELRKELQATGIFEALQKRKVYAAANDVEVRAVDLERKINNAAVSYTKFNTDLDQDLRNIASDFLFNAYKNSITVEDSSYQIGKITIEKEVPFYRRGVAYETVQVKPRDGKSWDNPYRIGMVEIKNAKIEFENEQINNIEITGNKKGKPKPYVAIRPDQKEIYIKIFDDIYPVTIPDKEQMIRLINGKDFTVENPIVKGEMHDFDGTFLGMVYVWVADFEAIGIIHNPKGKKRYEKELAESLDKEIAFDFYLNWVVVLPGEAEIKDSIRFSQYLERVLPNGKPRLIDVAFFNDKAGKDTLVTYKVKPNISLGLEYRSTVDFKDKTLKTYYKIPSDSQYDYHVVKAGETLYGIAKKYGSTVEELRNWNDKGESNIIALYDRMKVKKREKPRLEQPGELQNKILNSRFDSIILDKYHPVNAVKGRNGTIYDTLVVYNISRKRFSTSSTDGKKADYFPEGAKMTFRNRYPISYSTKEDITYIRASGNPKNEKRLYLDDNKHYILLSDVMTNDLSYYNNTENYSPKDQVLLFKDISDPKPIFKENTKDILKARIYSDFVGFDETNPNGLVQTEVSKRFFLNTSSTSSFQNFMYSGYLNSIEPSLTLSKIEQNNKFLELRAFSPANPGTDMDSTVNYVSSLDILRYTSLQIGATLGLAYFSIPKYHFRLQLGVGGYVHQSGFSNEQMIRDTAFNAIIQRENEFQANSLVYYPDIRLEFNPDPRFGLEFAYRPTYVALLSNQVLQVDNEARFLDSDGRQATQKVVNVLQLAASIRVNPETNGQFFFRSNFSLSGGDRNTNFLQAQIGYAFNIFTRDKEANAGAGGETKQE